MNKETNQHIETLSEIRNLMERSSRFISLSGLSGVFAGVYAITGAITAYFYLNLHYSIPRNYEYARGESFRDFVIFFFIDAILVLVLAVGTGIFLTTRKASKDGSSIFDVAAQKLIANLCIPLVVGGVFCLALIYHGNYGYIAPAMLIFYGLALINASKYTLTDIRYLGLLEIGLGLVSAFIVGYGLLFWSIGFGVLHIGYGIYMYYKHEK